MAAAKMSPTTTYRVVTIADDEVVETFEHFSDETATRYAKREHADYGFTLQRLDGNEWVNTAFCPHY